MVAISRAWYNGSYTMAAKPIKSLELHYTMIQFLIMSVMPVATDSAKMVQLAPDNSNLQGKLKKLRVIGSSS